MSALSPSLPADRRKMIQPISLDLERLATNLRVERSLIDVLDLLKEFPVVVFKGTLLTRLIYGDLRARASSDNDLWVSRPFISAALELLLAHGYRTEPLLDPRAELRRLGQVPLWLQGDFRNVAVDLHVEPFSDRYFSVDENKINENLLQLNIQGHQVTTFNRYLSLCHLVAHAIQHHFEEQKIRDLGAAWDAWGAELDVDRLCGLADATCTRAALEYCLWIASEFAWTSRSAPQPTVPRIKFLTRKCPAIGDESKEIYRKLLALFVVDPRRIPGGIKQAVLLEDEEFLWRYGPGRRPAHIIRHTLHMLGR